MSPATWKEQASELAPLLNQAESDGLGGQCAVLRQISEYLPVGARLGVVFSQPDTAGRIEQCFEGLGWRAICLGEWGRPQEPKAAALAPDLIEDHIEGLAARLTAALKGHQVPADFACLSVQLKGQDYWVWEALAATYKPALVTVSFNPDIDPTLAVSVRPATEWRAPLDKNYGCSVGALRSLATREGYRLIHVHGPEQLFFLRNDIAFPVALTVNATMSPSEWALLLDYGSFHDCFYGAAERPGWFTAPTPEVACEPWEVLAPTLPAKAVDLEGLLLEVADKYDPTWYLQRKTFEEKASLLYRFIRDEGFANFLDIGANVGLVSILAARLRPDLRVVAVEADPRLARLLRRNLQQHGLANAQVVNAIAGANDQGSAPFSLNPSSTLDNRVQVAGWRKVRVPMLRMDGLLERLGVRGKTFVKVDTQGFELQVLAGLEQFLTTSTDWVLKMEFAPDWLRSQGTDPGVLLNYLQLNYEFAEYPERIPFGTPSLDSLFVRTIAPRQHAELLQHVVAQNKGGLGWIDLIVRPKSTR